jgi:hypothetical protein
MTGIEKLDSDVIAAVTPMWVRGSLGTLAAVSINYTALPSSWWYKMAVLGSFISL